jgi:hypothetical protein
MKTRYALSAAALATSFTMAALPWTTQAQARSATTAERGAAAPKLPVRVVASMADTSPSVPESRGKSAEATSPRSVSLQADDFNWLQGGGG